jgi:hypothetical protein
VHLAGRGEELAAALIRRAAAGEVVSFFSHPRRKEAAP